MPCAHQRLHARWIVYALAAVTCALLAMAAAQTTEKMLHMYASHQGAPLRPWRIDAPPLQTLLPCRDDAAMKPR